MLLGPSFSDPRGDWSLFIGTGTATHRGGETISFGGVVVLPPEVATEASLVVIADYVHPELVALAIQLDVIVRAVVTVLWSRS